MSVRITAHRPPVLQRCGGRTCRPEGCGHDRVARFGEGPGPSVAPPVVHAVLSRDGAALPASLLDTMEHRLGHDFASVRVHTGALATDAARAVHARAFTVGDHVVLGGGEWAPGTVRGEQLLGHELIHVVQQRPNRGALPAHLPVSAPGEPAELEAARAADQLPSAGAGHAARVDRLPFGITLPTGLRGLHTTETAIGRAVYGDSIAYGAVYLSDATGLGGRPFTTAGPLGTTIISIGSAAYTTPGSNPSLLVHELAHVWQSQHHPSRVAFMANAVASQAAAEAAGASAYCYVPGKGFGSYGAEQIAQSAENLEAPIVAHMAGVTVGAPDAQNILSLTLPRWETPGAPGVKC